MIDDRLEAEDSGVIQLVGVSLVGLSDEGLEILKTLCSNNFNKRAPFLGSWLHEAVDAEICRREINEFIAGDVRPTLLVDPIVDASRLDEISTGCAAAGGGRPGRTDQAL